MTATTSTLATADLVRFLIARFDDADSSLRTRGRQARGRHDQHELDAVRHSMVEIDAQRRVLGVAQHLLVLRDLPSEKPVRDAATQILLSLAAPFDEHRGYRPEWRG